MRECAWSTVGLLLGREDFCQLMNSQLLIDAIVRQTMVFIAQLSTVDGVRSPLSHIADSMFVNLVRELESQGFEVVRERGPRTSSRQLQARGSGLAPF